MLKKLFVLIFFLLIAVIYLHNLTRDIYSGDVGDLVTASVLGGVPHPPGYPLFTLLGYIASKLPVSIPPVTKVGLISVFSSLVGLIILYFFAKKVTKGIFLSILTVSILAFSYLFWFHAEIPEVFALNNFFVIAVLSFAIKFYEKKNVRDLYILTFLTALSLTHHHTILLLFPGIALLILKDWKIIFLNKKQSVIPTKRSEWRNPFSKFMIKRFLDFARNDIQYKRIMYLFVIALLGLLPYLYVPLAAIRGPIINWDNAVNLQNFMQLILRKDYGGFAPSVFNGVPTVIKTILARDFLKTLVTLYSYQIVFVAVLGMFALFRKDKWLFLSMMTAFLIPGPFFIFYSANVITTTTAWGVNERFYLLASVVFIFFIPYGFLLLKQFIEKRLVNRSLTFVLLSYFLVVPFFLIRFNFSKTDLSKTQIGNNLASDILSYLPKNSVLFVSGDTTTFNIWYVRYVLWVRPDVDIINPSGVGGNWYLEKEINAFYKENPKTNLKTVVNSTIEKIRKERDIFASYDPTLKIKDSKFIPMGLVYQLVSTNNIPTEEDYLKEVEAILKDLKITRRETLTLAEQNLVAPEIPLIYSNGLIRIADYLVSQYDDPAKAEHYYRRALWIDPDNPGGHAGLGLSLYKAYGDCKNAQNEMKEAISIYPIWKKYYLQLYLLYNECKSDNYLKKELITLYKNKFNENLLKVLNNQLKTGVK